MKTIKDLLDDGDEVIEALTEQFIDNELSWEEFYALVKVRLKETGQDTDLANNYDRSMKGI